MAMQALDSARQVEFDDTLIGADLVRRLAALKVSPALAAAVEEDEPWLRDALASAAFARNEPAAFYDEAQVQAAVREAVETVSADDEFRPLLAAAPANAPPAADQVGAAVKAALLAPAPDPAAEPACLAVLQQLRTATDANGIFECRVGDTLLLRADTRLGEGKAVAVGLKIATVFLDVVGVVLAAAGVLADKGVEVAKRFVAFVERIQGWFMQMMERLWQRLAAVMARVRGATAAGPRFAAVKAAAKDVAAAIVRAVKWAKDAGKWTEFKSACKSAIGVMINSGWKKFIACCQLIASLILLCVSGGTSLLMKIVILVASLVVLVVDSIDLYDATHAG